MKWRELVSYLDDTLQVGRYADRSNNGLQVQPAGDDVTRVAFAVDACLASFEGAIAERAQLLITHHGLFWSEHMQLTGAHFERVKALICAGCGLYASHIPLDAHAEVGNNIELARIAGLQDIQPWGAYKGATIGFIGTLPDPLPLNELNARLEAVIGKGNRVTSTPGPSSVHGGGELVRRVAVCSGFGVTLIDEAIAAGADTLITGETSHTWHQQVAERPINVIYGGHYNTETVGVKALARHLEKQFGLQTVFIDLPTGL
jgi:dinuclear metal center YbgI/SA1388 family protein